MKSDKVHIYALVNPLDNNVFYIGATAYPSQRLAGHLSDIYVAYQNETHRLKCLRSVLESGCRPEFLRLDTVDKYDAAFWEDFYISLFKSYGFYLPQDKSNYKGKMLNQKPRFNYRKEKRKMELRKEKREMNFGKEKNDNAGT